MADWTGKRVIVTGGSGFLGSFVVDKLRERGCADVFVPRVHDYDLVDVDAVRRLYRDARPHVVIHVAARVGGIGANRANPGLFFYDNIMMGVQLIEEGRKAGIEKLVAIGTICSYPRLAPIPFREEDLWNGYPEDVTAPYGLAKKMLIVQSQAYRQQYGMNSVVVLPVNLYGPRDNFDPATSHVVPALVRKIDAAVASGARAVTVWGDGTATREFLYVEDCAEAIVLAAERYDSSEPVNLGSGREIAIDALVRTIGRLMGYTGDFVYDTSMPNGQPRRALDVTRARDRLGWTARTPFEEGMRRTIDWWRSHKP